MTILSRTIIAAAFVAASLPGASAFAADVAQTHGLAPGKPAGVHEARRGTGNALLVAAGGAALVAGLFVLSKDSGKSPEPPYVTTGTP